MAFQVLVLVDKAVDMVTSPPSRRVESRRRRGLR
jgi:hypothetical protein